MQFYIAREKRMFWEPERDGKNKIKINHAREREEGKKILKNRGNKERRTLAHGRKKATKTIRTEKKIIQN